MSKKRDNQFWIGVAAGAAVAYVLLHAQGNTAAAANPTPATMTLPGGNLTGLPPQPLTIRRMSATYIP